MSVFDDAYGFLLTQMGNLFDKIHNFFDGISNFLGVDITPFTDAFTGLIILISSPGILLTSGVTFIIAKIIYFSTTAWLLGILVYEMYVFVMCIYEGEFLMSIRRFIVYQQKIFVFHIDLMWTMISLFIDVMIFAVYEPIKIIIQFLAWIRQIFQL